MRAYDLTVTGSFAISGSDKITFTDAGKLGIGTSNPGAELEIKGIARDTELFVIERFNDTQNFLEFKDVSNDPSLEIFKGDGQTFFKINETGDIFSEIANAKISGSSTSTGSFGQLRSGPQIITNNLANNVGLIVDTNAETNAIQTDAKWGPEFSQTTSDGTGLTVVRNNNDTETYPLVRFTSEHATTTQPTLTIKQDGAGYGLEIDQNGDKAAIYIDTEATTQQGILFNAPAQTSGDIIRIGDANSLTSGRMLFLESNSSDSNSRELIRIINDHASATGTTPIYIQNDSTGGGIEFRGTGHAISGSATSTGSFGMVNATKRAAIGASLASTDATLVVHNATGAESGIKIEQDQGQYGLEIDQDGNNAALYIDSEATSNSTIYIPTPTNTGGSVLMVDGANSLTTGRIAYFGSNSSDTGTRNLVEIVNDHASATGATALKIQQDSTGLALDVDGKVDMSSTLSVGNNTITTSGGDTPQIQTHKTNNSNGLGVFQWGNNAAHSAMIKLTHSKSGTIGNHTILADNDAIGTIQFNGSDGTNFDTLGASIHVEVDGTPAANRIPGAMIFSTSAVSDDGNTERMRIDSSGNIGIGTSSPSRALHVVGDALVTGILTAQEFHTEFVSASVMFESGSTKFGDDTADRHEFTGSVFISGSSLNLPPTAKLHLDGGGNTFVREVSNNLMEVTVGGSSALTIAPTEIQVPRYITHMGDGNNYIDFETDTQTFITDGGNTLQLLSNHDVVASQGNIIATSGNVSGSATSTGSFGMVHAANKLGVGTSSPTVPFHVKETTASTDLIARLEATADIYLQFAPADTLKWAITPDYPNTNDFNIYNYPNNRNDITVKGGTGRVGIGVTNPVVQLDVYGSLNLRSEYNLTWGGTAGANIPLIYGKSGDGGHLAFHSQGTDGESLRLDASNNAIFAGNVSGSATSTGSFGTLQIGEGNHPYRGLVGHNQPLIQVETSRGFGAGISVIQSNNDAYGALITLGKSRGTPGTNTTVQDGDVIGRIAFSAADGTDMRTNTSEIRSVVNGTVVANSVPSDLVLMSGTSGSADATERMRLTSAGNVGIGTTTPSSQLNVVRSGTVSDNDTVVLADISFTKTGGDADQSTLITGLKSSAIHNDANSGFGNLTGGEFNATNTQNKNAAGNGDNIMGISANTSHVAGIVNTVTGVNNYINVDAGGVDQYVAGSNITVDVESAVNITGDVYGQKIYMDVDDTNAAQVWGLEIEDGGSGNWDGGINTSLSDGYAISGSSNSTGSFGQLRSGPQIITNNLANNSALTIDNNTEGYAIVSNAKWGPNFTQDSADGRGLEVSRNNNDTESHPLVSFTSNHTAATQPTLKIQQDGASQGILIEQNGAASALKIDQNANDYALEIVTDATSGQGINVNASSLQASGMAARFYSNSSNSGTRKLIDITNDHASATGTTLLNLQQDSTGDGIHYTGGGHAISGSSTSTGSFGQVEASNIVEGSPTGGTQIMRSIRLNISPGDSPGTNITVDHDVTAGRSFNTPSLTDGANITNNTSNGSFALNNGSTRINVDLGNAIGVLSECVLVHDLNGSSTSAGEIYFSNSTVSSNDLSIALFKSGNQSLVDWRTVLAAGDSITIQIAYMSSS